METTERIHGACRYCGQIINIKSYLALHPNLKDPDEDAIATLMCDCKEARRDRDTHEAALRGESDRIEALQKANDVIEELLPAIRTRSAWPWTSRHGRYCSSLPSGRTAVLWTKRSSPPRTGLRPP